MICLLFQFGRAGRAWDEPVDTRGGTERQEGRMGRVVVCVRLFDSLLYPPLGVWEGRRLMRSRGDGSLIQGKQVQREWRRTKARDRRVHEQGTEVELNPTGDCEG